MTVPNTQPGVADRFLKDVAEVAAELRKNPDSSATGMVRIEDPIVVSFLNIIIQTQGWNIKAHY